jgi:hypothetical protein
MDRIDRLKKTPTVACIQVRKCPITAKFIGPGANREGQFPDAGEAIHQLFQRDLLSMWLVHSDVRPGLSRQ